MKKRKAALIFSGITSLFFILTSTAYLPYYLVNRIESEYLPFKAADFSFRDEDVFIHVLGGGYTYDSRLPAHGQLSTQSLGRLAEGLRINNSIQKCTLIFSGDIVSGRESMASVMKQAAISLGADSSRIQLLEQAGTTKEEVQHFLRRYGSDVILIVVTDAIHIPRAMRFFNEVGIHPYAAPTNYLIQQGRYAYSFRWIPSAENFMLMDRVLREFLGSIKASII